MSDAMSQTSAPAPAEAVWAAALADGSGRHVPVRKHWPELAAALDAVVDDAVPDTGQAREPQSAAPIRGEDYGPRCGRPDCTCEQPGVPCERLEPGCGAQAREKAVCEAASQAFRAYTGTREGEPMWNLDMESTWQIIAPAVVAALDSRAVPDTGQARANHLAAGIRKFADDCKLLLDSGGLDNRVVRSIAQQERNLRALLAADSAPEPSGYTDTRQASR